MSICNLTFQPSRTEPRDKMTPPPYHHQHHHPAPLIGYYYCMAGNNHTTMGYKLHGHLRGRLAPKSLADTKRAGVNWWSVTPFPFPLPHLSRSPPTPTPSQPPVSVLAATTRHWKEEMVMGSLQPTCRGDAG